MSKSGSETAEPWATAWLNTVAGGLNAMSQRKLSSIEKHGGGLNAVKSIAERLGVHLLVIEDDEGNEVVAASKKPFKVIC